MAVCCSGIGLGAKTLVPVGGVDVAVAAAAAAVAADATWPSLICPRSPVFLQGLSNKMVFRLGLCHVFDSSQPGFTRLDGQGTNRAQLKSS